MHLQNVRKLHFWFVSLIGLVILLGDILLTGIWGPMQKAQLKYFVMIKLFFSV